MEPRQFHPEQASIPTSNPEQPKAGEFPLPNIERQTWNNPEQNQPRPAINDENQQIPGAMPAVLPAPVIIAEPVANSPASDSPIVAADEDLIEKEWVDKAKQIITATKDDPYRREQEIKRLQLDYVRKRYGKDIGAAEG